MTLHACAATVQFQHRANDKNSQPVDHGTLYHGGGRATDTAAGLPGNVHHRLLASCAICPTPRCAGGPIATALLWRAFARWRERYNMAIGVGLDRAGRRRPLLQRLCRLSAGRRAACADRNCTPSNTLAIASGYRYTVFDTPGGVRVGVLIRWTTIWWRMVRATALLGAEVLIAPHQTGGTYLAQPARHEADPAGAVATACGRSAGNRSRLSRRTRPRRLDALATVARSRHWLFAVQQRRAAMTMRYAPATR